MPKRTSVPAASNPRRHATDGYPKTASSGTKQPGRWLQTVGSCWMVLAMVLGPAPSAEATEAGKSKKTSVKQSRSPAEETKAERDRRLYRECAGRPNAGACLGYTRKP